MKRIRVLIVDDAVVVRRMVSDVLAADPGIEVVGTAANGRIGLQKIPQVNPDVVTLDVEMPELDGLQTLKAIRETWKTLPVIMFSTLTERGAAETLTALSLGASDYVTKPANVGSVALAQQRIKDELIPKVKALCGVAPVTEAPTLRPRPAVVLPPRPAMAGAPVADRTPDILATLSAAKRPGQWLLGFAAESEAHLSHAAEKLSRKRLDAIFANDVAAGQGFGAQANTLTPVTAEGAHPALGPLPKDGLAAAAVAWWAGRLASRA